MNFAQVLARIEELRSYDRLAPDYRRELEDLLIHYAGSIVQLGKVAGKMRESLGWLGDDEDSLDTPVVDNPIKLALAMEAYDKLMKGEE